MKTAVNLLNKRIGIKSVVTSIFLLTLITGCGTVLEEIPEVTQQLHTETETTDANVDRSRFIKIFRNFEESELNSDIRTYRELGLAEPVFTLIYDRFDKLDGDYSNFRKSNAYGIEDKPINYESYVGGEVKFLRPNYLIQTQGILGTPFYYYDVEVSSPDGITIPGELFYISEVSSVELIASNLSHQIISTAERDLMRKKWVKDKLKAKNKANEEPKDQFGEKNLKYAEYGRDMRTYEELGLKPEVFRLVPDESASAYGEYRQFYGALFKENGTFSIYEYFRNYDDYLGAKVQFIRPTYRGGKYEDDKDNFFFEVLVKRDPNPFRQPPLKLLYKSDHASVKSITANFDSQVISNESRDLALDKERKKSREETKKRVKTIDTKSVKWNFVMGSSKTPRTGFESFCRSFQIESCSPALSYDNYMGLLGRFTDSEFVVDSSTGQRLFSVVLETGEQFYFRASRTASVSSILNLGNTELSSYNAP